MGRLSGEATEGTGWEIKQNNAGPIYYNDAPKVRDAAIWRGGMTRGG